MHDLIGENSGRVHLNSEAILLEKHGEKINIVFKNGEPRLFDKIVLALPLPVSKNLIKNLVDKKTFNGLSGLKTIGALALILRLKKPLLKDNVYWLNILQEKAPFIALVEHTNFINKKYYNNEHIVYLGGYYSPNDLIFKKSEKEIWQQFLPFLKKINPNVEKNLIGLESFSSLLAQPIIPINYSKKRPPNTLLDGKIILASPNHIFPWDRGVNYSVKLGKQAASLV